MKLGRLVGIVGAVLLIMASQAWAECAWVLWTHVTILNEAQQPWRREEHWRLRNGYQTHEQCKAELARLDKLPDTIPKVSAVQVCLPDTVDPREPKGK